MANIGNPIETIEVKPQHVPIPSPMPAFPKPEKRETPSTTPTEAPELIPA